MGPVRPGDAHRGQCASLDGSDHRNRGRREGGLLELPVEIGPANFPVAQGVFEMHGAFPCLRGLDKLS